MTYRALLVVAATLAAGCRAEPTGQPREEPMRRGSSLPRVGPPAQASPELERAFEPAGHFQEMAKPQPGDWLAEHEEDGQTFQQWVHSQPNLPDERRRTIYVLPIGAFPAGSSPSPTLSAEHAPTPAHPRTHATHTLDINSPRL